MQDFRSYHSICRDIVTRWVYPLVPDAQLLPGSTYAHTKRYTYRENGVRVSRSAVIGDAVVLSRGTLVGDNVQLRRTIVGRDCVIGNNCKITDSHIWKGLLSFPPSFLVSRCQLRCATENLFAQHLRLQQNSDSIIVTGLRSVLGAIIESNVTIDRAIICDGVVVGAGAVIPRGCVLSYGVTIGAGAVLPEFTRVARRDAEEEVRHCEYFATKHFKHFRRVAAIFSAQPIFYVNSDS